MEMTSRSLPETANFARNFLGQLTETSRPKATIVALYGDLGSGKTTFTQFLAKELGVTNYVTSPTFVIEKKYPLLPEEGWRTRRGGGSRLSEESPLSRGGYKTLIHIDCYRLAKPDELLHLDWAELVTDPTNLIVVEWPERIESILPADAIKIEFEFVNEASRSIKIK